MCINATVALTVQAVEYVGLRPVRITDALPLTHLPIVLLIENESRRALVVGEGEEIVMHYTPIVVANLQGVDLLWCNNDEVVVELFGNVLHHDRHKLVPVRSLVFMPEAQCMANLVCY